MRITIDVEVVQEQCQHAQNDGSKTYYAFRVLGLANDYGEQGLTMRSSEGSYPGNDAMRAFINAHLAKG